MTPKNWTSPEVIKLVDSIRGDEPSLMTADRIFEKVSRLPVPDQVDFLEKMGISARAIALTTFDKYITEDNTDWAIEWLVGELPLWLRWPVGKALDVLFPDHIRGLLLRLLYPRVR